MQIPSDIEPDFSQPALALEHLDANPISQFAQWFRQACADGYSMPHGMSLATASADGQPTVRTVLLKRYDDEGFVFFTNYQSCKAQQISENPRASLLFPWIRLGRQNIASGRVE